MFRSILNTVTPIYIQRKPTQTGSGMYSDADVLSLPSWCHYYSHLCSQMPRLFLDCSLVGTAAFNLFHSSPFYIHQCSLICQKTRSKAVAQPTLILSCGRAVVLPQYLILLGKDCPTCSKLFFTQHSGVTALPTWAGCGSAGKQWWCRSATSSRKLL